MRLRPLVNKSNTVAQPDCSLSGLTCVILYLSVPVLQEVDGNNVSHKSFLSLGTPVSCRYLPTLPTYLPACLPTCLLTYLCCIVSCHVYLHKVCVGCRTSVLEDCRHNMTTRSSHFQAQLEAQLEASTLPLCPVLFCSKGGN